MTLTNKKILIVEDDPDIAQPMGNSLAKFGCHIVGIVPSGPEAIQKARETFPDIVLMDVILAGMMDGIETGKRINTELKIPILYMTGYMDKAAELEAIGKLPVLKPFRVETLKNAIEVVFYRSSLNTDRA